MTMQLTREQVDAQREEMQALNRNVRSAEHTIARVIEERDAVKADLARVTAELIAWKHTAKSQDALDDDIEALEQANGRLRGIIKAILNADERGQGLPFKEAMDEARNSVFNDK